MVGRKLALITDTHFGARKGSQIFHDYFAEFYHGTFFQYLDDHNIDTVVHLGDCFDNRKAIDYWSLNWSKQHFFNELYRRGIELHLIVGNHDIFYKDNLSINSAILNLAEYDNISIYNRPQTVSIGGSLCFMVPWICNDNAEQFVTELEASKAPYCFGHLELAGFYANKDYQCQHGTDSKIFSKFDRVFSGHFHKKSTSGNITYLGNPYQLYWNDEGDVRGFHILDLDTQELEFIENPNTMFHKIFYDGKKSNKIDLENLVPNLQSSYVKLIVQNSTPQKLNRVVDKLYDVGIHDLKVIENIDLNIDEDVEVESEDTLTTLTNYVNALEDVNRDSVINIFKSLYVEAQEV